MIRDWVRILFVGFFILLSASGNAQWSRFGEPPGGFSLLGQAAGVAAVDSSGDLFVTKAGGPYWRRSFGAINWQTYSVDTFTTTFQSCLATLPTGDMLTFIRAHGLYRSTDRGQTWHSEVCAAPDLNAVAADGAGHVLLAGFRLFHRGTQDTGWIQTTTTPKDSNFTHAIALANNVFLVATSVHIYKSTDAGVTWQESDAGIQPYGTIDFCLDHNGNVLTISGQKSSAIYRSTDMGQHWAVLSRDIPSYNLHHLNKLRDGSIVVSTAGTGNGTYFSRNDGQNFDYLASLWGKTPFEVLQGQGSTVFGLTDEGIFASNNNMSNWQPIDAGFAIAAVHTLAQFGDTLFASFNSRGIAKTIDGHTWTFANDSLVDDVYSLLVHGNVMYAYSTSEPFVYEGGMWHTLPQFFDPGTVGSGVIDKSGKVFIGGRNGLYYLTSTGWHGCQDLLQMGIRSVVCDSLNDLYAFVGDSLYSSTDDGISFNVITIPNRTEAITAIGISNDTFAVATQSFLYRTTDQGVSWSAQAYGSKIAPTFIGLHGGQTFAVTARQVWQQAMRTSPFVLDTGYGKSTISYLTVSNSNTAYLGTMDSGIYSRALPPLPSNGIASNPERLAIAVSVWPNPSAGRVMFSNLLQGPIDLIVTSSDGREVLRTTFSPNADGEAELTLPIPAGEYFCKLGLADKAQVVKLSIVK